MKEDHNFEWVKTSAALLFLLLFIPFYLAKTIFNKALDPQTRITHGILSIPSAIMIFFIGIISIYVIVWFFIATFTSDAWLLGVYGIFVLFSIVGKIIQKIKESKDE